MQDIYTTHILVVSVHTKMGVENMLLVSSTEFLDVFTLGYDVIS